MARDDPHFRLRVPEELRDRIAEAAKANNRSMNAEIVARLEDTFREIPMGAEPVMEAFLNAMLDVDSEVLTRILDKTREARDARRAKEKER